MVEIPTEGVDPNAYITNKFVVNKSESESESNLDVVADIAEFANGVASLVVGHRHILVEGGFDPNMADAMCQALHAKLLGLDIWDDVGVEAWPDFEDEDE